MRNSIRKVQYAVVYISFRNSGGVFGLEVQF